MKIILRFLLGTTVLLTMKASAEPTEYLLDDSSTCVSGFIETIRGLGNVIWCVVPNSEAISFRVPYGESCPLEYVEAKGMLVNSECLRIEYIQEYRPMENKACLPGFVEGHDLSRWCERMDASF
jgi:hypothetical protein